MKHNLPHLPKAVIKEIRDQFGLLGIDHYKEIDGKLEFVPEDRHELDNLNEIFENTYLKKIAKNKSVRGFIDREIKWAKKHKKTITTSKAYYYDLLVEWVSFLELKKSTLKPSQATKEIKENETYENPFPKFFTSYIGFQIFEAFKNEIIIEETEYADYSFLFGKLLKDEFIHEMKHKKFIDFLGGEPYKAKFASNYKQFKYSETLIKKKAYSRIKKQFQ